MQESPVQFLGWEDPLEESMATHSNILAWRIPMDRRAWQATWSHKESDTTEWLNWTEAPLSMGVLQTRILEWVAMLSSRGSSQPRDQTQVSCTAGRFFTVWAIREAHTYLYFYPFLCCSFLLKPQPLLVLISFLLRNFLELFLKISSAAAAKSLVTHYFSFP